MTYRVFIENNTRIIVMETTDDSIEPPDTMTAIELPIKIDHSQDNGIKWWKLLADLTRVPASEQEISDSGMDGDVENQKQILKIKNLRNSLTAVLADSTISPEMMAVMKALLDFYGA